MPKLEFDIDGYVLTIEGTKAIDPDEPIWDTLVRSVEAWDAAIDLSTFEVQQQNPDEYLLEFETADGRTGQQTLEFQDDDALLTWDIPDQITREEYRPYPEVRRVLFTLIEDKGIDTLDLTYT